jgi:hypothetical protein
VIGEYCSEGAIAPLLMTRRGHYKFVHSTSDPDQLFDREANPQELTNPVTEPAHQGLRKNSVTRSQAAGISSSCIRTCSTASVVVSWSRGLT